MVQTQNKPVYKAPSFGTKEAEYKKSQFDFKGQERKEAPKANDQKSQNPWGKTFKNEQHFKGLHMC